MFCPKCKAEYREGFYKCADCEIDLVYELPPEPEQYTEYEYINLVNIKTYTDRHEAEFAKGLLLANGIYAVVPGDEGRVYRHQLAFGVYELLVKEEDVQEAKNILSETIRKHQLADDDFDYIF